MRAFYSISVIFITLITGSTAWGFNTADEGIKEVEHHLRKPLDKCELILLRNGFDAIQEGKTNDWLGFIKPKMTDCESPNRRFALDTNQIQVLRKESSDFVRFGFRKTDGGIFISIVEPSAFKGHIHLKDAAPNSYELLQRLHSEGRPVIAILGGARIRERQKEAFDAGKTVIDVLAKARAAGFITGGYKGVRDAAYGYTRVGYDAAKEVRAPTLVVMPEAGKLDRHNNPDALDIYGELWGDDTPALTAIADAAVVFAPYGAWTEVEMAYLQRLGKPVIVVDTKQHDSELSIELAAGDIYVFSPAISSYKSPSEAAHNILSILNSRHSPEELKKEATNNDRLEQLEQIFEANLRQSLDQFDFLNSTWARPSSGPN